MVVDHGLGHVETLFLVADEKPPSDHPAEGVRHHPQAWEDAKALRVEHLGDT